MDTPEAARRASASPSVQDSPFFSYINSLSPINLVNAGNVAHGDLTVPSPQPVFTSPHTSLPRKVNLVRRSQKPIVSGSEKLSPGFADETPHTEDAEVSGPCLSLPMFQLIPITQEERDNDDSSQDHSSSSHLSCVDEFLLDPTGDSSASPGLILSAKPAAEFPQGTQDASNNTSDKVNKSDEDHGEAQPCTPSGCVNKFLSELVGSTSTDSPDTLINKPTDLTQVLRSDCSLHKEATLGLHIPKSWKGEAPSASLNLNPSFEFEDVQIGQRPSSPVNRVTQCSLSTSTVFDNATGLNCKSHEEQLEQVPNSVNICIDSDLLSVPASGTQYLQTSAIQIAHDHLSVMSKESVIADHGIDSSASSFCCHGSEDVNLHFPQNWQSHESNCSPELRPESIQKINHDKNPVDDAGVKPSKSSDNQTPYEQEEGTQQLRGMRKRLQFEAVENQRISSGRDKSSLNFTTVSAAEPPETSLDVESLHFTPTKSVSTSSNKKATQLVNHQGNDVCLFSQCSFQTPENHAGEVDKSVPTNESPFIAVPRPSGIGLHLNSIGNMVPSDCCISMQVPRKDMIVKGKKSLPGNKVSLDPQSWLASTSLKIFNAVKLTASSENLMLCSATKHNEEELKEKHPTTLLNSSSKHQSTIDVKFMSSYPHSNIRPCNTKRLLEDSILSEESTLRSPRKKRKKESDNDGCKRCKCKRSKCLKLYCDCFAAGVFCTEDCSCKECFNRQEHQDMVMGTRVQIESRNPLAFAPKVVIRANEAQEDKEGSRHATPTSARHKRGCNCKKSLCLKKYCECYQAGVGCSLGCRCEGCKNTFGRKGGFGGGISELERKILQKEIEPKKSMEEEWEGASSSGKLEVVDARIKMINAKLCCSRLSPLTPLLQCSSSENDAPKSQFTASYHLSSESSASVLPSPTESPSSPRIPLCSSTSTDAREEFLSLVPYNHEPKLHDAHRVDSLSPGWDGFPDICNLSPLPNPSPIASSSSAASQTREYKGLHAKLCQGSGRISNGTLWRSSPVTPLPHCEVGKFVFKPDSDNGQHKIVEDNTPDVFKDLRPIKAVKATSPNQKRISPPQLLHEAPSSISPGIKSGRKFILQSVPSFPPLTPYSNIKGHGT